MTKLYHIVYFLGLILMVDETDAKTSKQWLKRLLIAGVFLFLGYTVADFEAASLRATVSQKQGTLSHALAENSTLKERIAALEVQLSILKHNPNEAVIQQLLAEQQTLKQQLELYQQVLNVDEAKRYLNIHTVSIKPVTELNTYSLSLLLLQGRAIKSVINGDLNIVLEGVNAGEPQMHNLADLLSQSVDVATDNSPLRFRYQYFLDLAYTFSLPDGFEPQKLTITSDVYQWKTKRESVEKAYLWLEILDENTQVLDNNDI